MTEKTKALADSILFQCQRQELTYEEAQDLVQRLKIVIECAKEETARKAVLTDNAIRTVTERLGHH